MARTGIRYVRPTVTLTASATATGARLGAPVTSRVTVDLRLPAPGIGHDVGHDQWPHVDWSRPDGENLVLGGHGAGARADGGPW